MKTVAFVPVKLNNQRLPGKNIKEFEDGTPLITYFLQKLIRVSEFDEIYVFCSDKAIEKYLVEGVRYLKRPEYLDSQSATPQNIISEFMNLVDADVYAVCHCTSPFVTSEHISECVKAVMNNGYDSSFLGEKIQRLLWDDKVSALNFTPDDIPRTQDLAPIYAEVSAAYVFRKDTFTNLNRRVGINPYIVEIGGAEAVDIDYPEDFMIANAIYMGMLRKK